MCIGMQASWIRISSIRTCRFKDIPYVLDKQVHISSLANRHTNKCNNVYTTRRHARNNIKIILERKTTCLFIERHQRSVIISQFGWQESPPPLWPLGRALPRTGFWMPSLMMTCRLTANIILIVLTFTKNLLHVGFGYRTRAFPGLVTTRGKLSSWKW
jgi:hypothetical protein